MLFSQHQLTRAELTGSPARFEQSTNGSTSVNTGQAERMLFELDTGILELLKNARFADGTNEIKGDSITYDVQGAQSQRWLW